MGEIGESGGERGRETLNSVVPFSLDLNDVNLFDLSFYIGFFLIE